MGLFSAKKTILVSSAAYNMAGDINDRPDYMKTTVTGAVIKGGPTSLSEQITGSYLRGPGIKLRSFGRWGRSSGYNSLVGQTASEVRVGNNLNQTQLASQIPHTDTQTVEIQTAEVGSADYAYWADQYMTTNHPQYLKGSYVVDFQESTNTVAVLLPTNVTETFVITNFDPTAYYIYSSYILTEGAESEPIVVGTVQTLNPTEDFPNTIRWTLVSSTMNSKIYERTDYVGQVPGVDRLQATRKVMSQWTSSTDRTYRIDTQKMYLKSWSGLKVFIYKYGSGNAVLDNMFTTPISAGSFFPFIPIRLNNNFISDAYVADLYEPSKKAMKKSTGGKFNTIVDKLGENDKLSDIDYAYTVFGVSLNTKDNAAKRYLYEFFQEYMLGQSMTGNGYAAWRVAWNQAKVANEAWLLWKAGQIDENSTTLGDPEPLLLPYPEPPSAIISINSANRSDINYNMQVYWSGIEETSHSGHGKAGVKTNEIWVEDGGTESFVQSVYADGTKADYEAYSMDTTKIYWQVDDLNYRKLTIWGLSHRNMIYGGKAVYINASDAMKDGEESGFIVPIHEDIYRRMPLKEATQMATACCYLVLNSYKIVKQKWYQTSWFKIVLIVAIIIFTIWTGGAGGSSVGLLGTNAAVGAALGYVGTAAIIAGAVANAVAAMILTQIVTAASTAIFGDKIGLIIGTIASLVAIQAGSAYMSGQTVTSSYGNLMKADSILKLTVAAGKGYGGYMQSGAEEIIKQTQTMLNDYAQQSTELSKLVEQNFGNSFGAQLDPIEITSATDNYVNESLDSFLSRTLMTGPEVANMSLDMISNFSDITTSTLLRN